MTPIEDAGRHDASRAAVDHLLSTTRSVRRRLDVERPVDRATVEECLQLALQAPSASNGQTWFWSLVDEPSTRTLLAEIYADCWGKYRRLQERRRTAMAAPDAEALDRLLASGDALTAKMADVPVLVVPCVRGPLSDSPTLLETASYFGSIFPAVWSFQLALRSRGLGSVLTTIHLWRADDVAQILRIPPGATQCALLPVAYTIGTDFQPARRLPVSTVSEWASSG
jgi:nitroreductase